MTSLTVNEIFYSIQGESTYAGMPCVFIRLTYCNIRCVWCDTEYAFYDGKSMSVDEILDEVARHGCRLVELTGGEPLAQEGSFELLKALCDKGYEVLLETSGSISVANVDPRVRRIIDIKCPGSGMEKKNVWDNIQYLKPTDEVKFVVADHRDFDWSAAVVKRFELARRCPVHMSPVFGQVQPEELARWILESGLNVRLQMQMHKFIWEPETRGV